MVVERRYDSHSLSSEAFTMEKKRGRLSPLAEVELEALEAGREWTRRRIEKNLQRLADEQGKVSPPERSGAPSMSDNADSADDERGRSGG
jgi:hypothetical protein